MMTSLQTILMEYQTKRGGRLVLQDVTKPTTLEWGTPIEAFTAVMEIEKNVSRRERRTVATI